MPFGGRIVDAAAAGKDKETMGRHTPRVGAALRDCATIWPEMMAPANTVTLDSTFIRSCEDVLLQVRCAVYNGAFGSDFGQKFQPANDPYPRAAMAA